jgi:quercetin dioxygenase-like cupin family protein
MAIWRMYTGPDGQSHMGQLGLDTNLELTELQPTGGIKFFRIEAGHKSDWHPERAPRWIIYLAGAVEFHTSDGTHRFGAGDALLAEDITGHGHWAEAVEGPLIGASVPVPARAP